MVDLPQHASELAVLRNLGNPSFPFSKLFEYHWFTPYWFGYALALFFARFLGIVTALKVVVSLALACFPISAYALIRQMKGDTFWAWLCLPGMYGFAYQWGLLNFLVAIPVGLLFLTLVAWYAHAPGNSAPWWLAISVLALFFCHALICALFGLIAAAYLTLESSDLKTAARRVSPLLAPLPLMLYYLRNTSATPTAVNMSTGWDLGWFNAQNDPYYALLASIGGRGSWDWGRMSGFFPRLLGLRPSPSCVLLGTILLALPLLSGSKLNRTLPLCVPLLTLVGALLFMPNVLLGNTYTYQRLTVFFLPFFGLLWAPQEQSTSRSKLAFGATVAIGFIYVAIFAAQARAFAMEQSGFGRLLADMAPKERVLSLIVYPESAVGIAPLFLHFPAWYTAEKEGFTDPSFASFGIEPIRFRRGAVPPARTTGFEWFPGTFDWNTHRGNDYRYFVVRFQVDASRVLFRKAPCPINLVDHDGEWWLYEKSPACGSAEPSTSELKNGENGAGQVAEARHVN